MKVLNATLLAAFLACFLSCEDGPDLAGRIVGFEIEAHIEGMRIGESPEAILNSFLSTPDTLLTALGGDLFLQYGDSMTVQLTKLNFDDPGYVLGGVYVRANYSGVSARGIQLGMTASEVQDLIRAPDQVLSEDNFLTLSYESSQEIFDLYFIDQVLLAIRMSSQP